MNQNIFNNIFTPFWEKIKKNYKKLSANAITDLVNVPLVDSCLLRYGNARCVAYNNYNGRLVNSKTNEKFYFNTKHRNKTKIK